MTFPADDINAFVDGRYYINVVNKYQKYQNLTLYIKHQINKILK